MPQVPPTPLSHPLATHSEAPVHAQPFANDLPPVVPPTDDPAFQPPRDPLKDTELAKQLAGVVYREIPMPTVATSWTVPQMRQALQALVDGMFDMPAQLCDAVMGDDRVQATLGSRIAGLLGGRVKFRVPKGLENDTTATECMHAWKEAWPTIGAEASMSEIQRWAIMLDSGLAQILWDTSDEMWIPHLVPMHPRFTFYHWVTRQRRLITLDGLVPITPGDGKWFCHCPHGEYRGWMQSTVRALSQPWIIRQLAMRDWARWSEKYGLLTVLAETPAAADSGMVEIFKRQLAALGQEPVIQLPQGVDKQNSFGLKFLEASATGFEGFRMLIEMCDMAITLGVHGQNLTTEIGKEGSYAAARVHAGVQQKKLEADERAWSRNVYTQISRPFAAFNFGDARYATITEIDVEPVEDNKVVAETFDKIGDAILKLGKAGIGLDIDHLGKLYASLGIPLGAEDLKEVERIASSGLGQ